MKEAPKYLFLLLFAIVIFKGINIKIELSGENKLNLSNLSFERLHVETHAKNY
jgi:hypothetical protein